MDVAVQDALAELKDSFADMRFNVFYRGVKATVKVGPAGKLLMTPAEFDQCLTAQSDMGTIRSRLDVLMKPYLDPKEHHPILDMYEAVVAAEDEDEDDATDEQKHIAHFGKDFFEVVDTALGYYLTEDLPEEIDAQKRRLDRKRRRLDHMFADHGPLHDIDAHPWRKRFKYE